MRFNCLICDKEFIKYLSKKNIELGRGKYCSIICMNKKRAVQGNMTGKKHSEKTKLQMSKSAIIRVAEKPHTIPDWTGKKHSIQTRINKIKKDIKGIRGKGNYRIGYINVHKWVRRRFEIKKQCMHCDFVGQTHLANKTGNYLYDITDWLELCPKCHSKYDRENKLFNKFKDEICV